MMMTMMTSFNLVFRDGRHELDSVQVRFWDSGARGMMANRGMLFLFPGPTRAEHTA